MTAAQRPKILIVSHSAEIGGAEICLRTLARHLPRTAFDLSVVFPSEGPLRTDLADSGLRVLTSPLEWWIRPRGSFTERGRPLQERVDALVRILDAERPDLVHTNSSVVCEGAMAAALLGIPHVWHVHEILPGHPTLTSAFSLFRQLRWMGEHSARLVAVSNAVRDSLAGSAAPERIVTIPNGFAPEDEPAVDAAADLRAELAIPAGELIAITVGHLSREKGQDLLLDAAAIVRDRGAALRFVLVGAGTAQSAHRLRSSLKRKGLAGSVHYLGFRRDAFRLIQQSDVLVLPSRSESFSLVLLQAMSAAKPVIATDCGGPGEIVVDGVTGIVTPNGDRQSMARSILALAGDRERMEAMGRAGKLRFEEGYRAEPFVRRILTLYESVLEEPAGAAVKSEVVAATRSFAAEYQDAYDRRRWRARMTSPRAWRWLRRLRDRAGVGA